MTASGRSEDSAEQKHRNPFVQGAINGHSTVFRRHYVVVKVGTIGEGARPPFRSRHGLDDLCL